MIEKNFDISFIADLALREKQIQQNYRPIIAVHKWFARRPGTLFRGLLLAEFSNSPLSETFYNANSLKDILVADPFMGGGTPLLEANRIGCNVIGFDINPMSYWIVRQEIEHLDLRTYDEAAESLCRMLESEIGHLYHTECILCGKKNVPVKYFLWVKVIQCRQCRKDIDLFPGYLISTDRRHPKNVLLCSACGQLTETGDRGNPGSCRHCGTGLFVNGPAGRNQCQCSHCQTVNYFPNSSLGPPRHRLFAIEYHCPSCKKSHAGRFFKIPDRQDLRRMAESKKRWEALRSRFVPKDEIPTGDETNRLHRWGYKFYREMFNARQLLGLELSARIIAKTTNERVRNALATNLSDLLRYQNMLCRYDTMALKSLDIFSVHGFPVGLIQCESNFLGIRDPNKNICVGSGGWANIIDKFRKAKSYCNAPFEVRHHGHSKEILPIRGEWIGDFPNGDKSGGQRMIDIQCRDSAEVKLPDSSLDAVFTDPPYFGNVQYAELMDFCYVWLRLLVGEKVEAFKGESTRHRQELTGNDDMGRGLEHFTTGLSSVFQRMAVALKPGAPLAFTYHHNDLKAYFPVAVAMLDAGLTCSASLPCPGEMGASIHINGTGSSIIDTVFVCRTTGSVLKKWLPASIQGVADLVKEDLVKLRQGQVKPTAGDIRCITYGHLVRLAIWNLRKSWNKNESITNKLSAVGDWLREFGGWDNIGECLTNSQAVKLDAPPLFVHEKEKNMELKMPTFPFEVSYEDILRNPDSYVDALFSCLESEFLIMPKGTGFVEYPVFERGYETLKAGTMGFSQLEPPKVLTVILREPISLVVLRTILGFTPPEWSYLTSQKTGVVVSQGFMRSLDRKVRMNPETPISMKGVMKERITALVDTACHLLSEGVPKTDADQLHRLNKADTKGGTESIRNLAGMGVPYAMLLYERFLGRPFAGHRDSVSELVGDSLESAIEEVLSRAGISFRKTKRAERIEGFDQAPDFIIPSEFNPQVIIEAKITEDDGTARDKVTRIQHLVTLSRSGQNNIPRYEVVACIGGRGFGVRREDMKRVIIATRGKVFTVKTLARLVEHTRLNEFRTK